MDKVQSVSPKAVRHLSLHAPSPSLVRNNFAPLSTTAPDTYLFRMSEPLCHLSPTSLQTIYRLPNLNHRGFMMITTMTS